MTWRTVILTKECKISLRLNHLVVTSENTVTIPITEIGQVIIENPNIVVTGHILNALSKRKITIIICNTNHMPFTHINLIYGHHRQPQKIKQQFMWKKSYKNKLWQNIVKEKINNQQMALRACTLEIPNNIFDEYIQQVELSDKTNREGHAAKVYFNKMFGLKFIRGSDNPINWALNYGYSLLLALFTRTITTKGFMTEVGIHHVNQFNHYNLASDFMEVYRPLIDVIVKQEIYDSFGKSEKAKLLDIFNKKVLIKNRKQYLPNSVDIYVESLFDYLEYGNSKQLFFPIFDF